MKPALYPPPRPTGEYYILNGVGDEGAVINLPLAGQFEVEGGNIVSLARGRESSNERLKGHKVEK